MPFDSALLRASVALSIVLPLAACGDDDHDDHHHDHDSGVAFPDTGPAPDLGPAPDAGPGTETITLRFRADVGGSPFACGTTYDDLGTSGTSYTPSDFRFYVHDVRLVSSGGDEVALSLRDGTWQGQGVALLDFEDGTGPCEEGGTDDTNTEVVGTAPEGEYTAVRFRLGIPEDLNHLNPATARSPLNVSSMFWVWLAGYKFVRVDGRTAGQPDGFLLHLGSTGCEGANPLGAPDAPCANPNRPEIELAMDPTTDTIVADVGRVFAESDLDANTTDTAPGCMSDTTDPECEIILPRLGIPMGSTPAEQVFFAVE